MNRTKRLIKRSLACALAGSMVIGSMSMTAFAEEESSISWEFKNGKLTISGTGEIDSFEPGSGNVSPWFDKRYEIREIEISEGITGIGDYAFYECVSLSDVIIPEGITTIGKSAFEGCHGLTNMGTDADAAGVEIPASVSYIGNNAFLSCNAVTDVYFFSQDLRGYVFDDENTLSDGSFDFNSVWGTKLHVLSFINPFEDDGTFVNLWYRQTPNAPCVLPDIEAEGQYLVGICLPAWNGYVTTDKTAAAAGEEVILTARPDEGFVADVKVYTGDDMVEVTDLGDSMYSFVMPEDNVTVDAKFIQGFFITFGDMENGSVSVEKDFAANASTVKVNVVPDAGYLVRSVTYTAYGNVNTITPDENGEYSFEMPWDNVTINATFEVDENYVPEDPEEQLEPDGQCGEEAYWNLTDGVLTIFGEGDMSNYGMSGEDRAPWCKAGGLVNKVVIGKKITSIGINSFYDCKSLKSVEFKGSAVKTIGLLSFSGCSGLEGIVIPRGVETIANSAFSNCYALQSVEISDTVVTIGEYAFYGCSGLTDLKIGKSVKLIDKQAFCECTSIKSVDIPASVETIGTHVFGGCFELSQLHIEDGVQCIQNEAFYLCWNLKEVVIPASVKEIGSEAFGYCNNLENVYIESSDFSKYHRNSLTSGSKAKLHIRNDIALEDLNQDNGGVVYRVYNDDPSRVIQDLEIE